MNRLKNNYIAFNEQWFEKHQRIIYWFLNAPIIKYLSRWILRIHNDVGIHQTINYLGPNRVTYGAKKLGKKVEMTTDFRTHWKFSKRIYYAFQPLWWALHIWDLFADRFIPQWSFGFSTLTAYPDPDPESATVDGFLAHSTGGTGTGVDWGTLVAAAGNGAADSLSDSYCIFIRADNVSNKWREIDRSIFLYNTSALTAGATITGATLSLASGSTAKEDYIAIAPDINIYSSTPASNTSLANGDFTQTGSTAFSTAISYASWAASGYNDFALNANGISNISLTGISKFSARNASYDVANSAPTWSTTDYAVLYCLYAENTGTTSDPKLVVTYTTASSSASTSRRMLLGIG